MPAELDSRHLTIRVVQIAAVIALVVAAISALPGLGELRSRFAHADGGWIVAVVLAELGSCAGYVLVFRETFCVQMSWGLTYDIAMAEQAANSLLPAGGAGGLALGAWALHEAGMPSGHIARRTVAFFVVTSAANFLGVIVTGLGMFLGILPGRDSIPLTLVPALVTLLGAILVAASPRVLRALGTSRSPARPADRRRRLAAGLRRALASVADGVEQALSLLRAHSLGVVGGSFAYMAFDIAALACGFAAFGQVPLFGTLVIGYLIGQLGNLIPLPGGVGGTEAGLVGTFALYGVPVAQAAAAVLAYRAFQLLVPALLGVPAFVMLRRRLLRADQPAAMCTPLGMEGLEIVELPGSPHAKL